MENLEDLARYLEDAQEPTLDLEPHEIHVCELPPSAEQLARVARRVAERLALSDEHNAEAQELFTALAVFHRETGT